ncbi:MAG: N-acetyltransferase GCN5 [Acidimicrobiales bacterium]|nr:MAG: N-acetyltransferase GCN5 [Acidimicrobiales bacterium]
MGTAERTPDTLRFVPIEPRWAEALEAIELASFPSTDPEDLYDADELRELASDFPDGSFVVLDGDVPVAMGCGVRVNFDLTDYQHTFEELFPHGDGSGDDPDGEWYYGTDISVHPDYRRLGIGARLYDLRKQVCRDLNLRGIIAGGVLPGYADHKHAMSAADYVERVKAGELTDPTLTFQLGAGFEAIGVLANYLTDPRVDNWASMIVWHNPDYREPTTEDPT